LLLAAVPSLRNAAREPTVHRPWAIANRDAVYRPAELTARPPVPKTLTLLRQPTIARISAVIAPGSPMEGWPSG
jgi:hypothetical protein